MTGSLSKAYSLAGIRIGWIASRSPEIIAACFQARDYTTISVSQIDDQIAAFALSPCCLHRLLERNIELAKTNLEILQSFVEQHRWACQWTRPVAGTTAFIKFSRNGKEINNVEFCEQIMDKARVMFTPGSKCFGHGKDFKGYVRMGYVCKTQVLIEGLEEVRNFMKVHYENISLAD